MERGWRSSGQTTGTHDDGFAEQTPGQGRCTKGFYTATSGTLSENGNIIRIASKLRYVFLHPFEGFYLVKNTIVAAKHDGDSLLKVRGQEKMLCHFARMKDLGHFYGRGIGMFNEAANRFEPILRDSQQLMPYPACGHPMPVRSEGVLYWYFAVPFPPVGADAGAGDVPCGGRPESVRSAYRPWTAGRTNE